MAIPFRTVVNVNSGRRTNVPLTDEEIATAASKHAAFKARRAIEFAEEQRRAARKAQLEVFLDKLEADPTLIDRIR